MSKSKSRLVLSRMVNRFLDHKRTLGHRYRHEAWVLQMFQRHVEQSDCRDLNAKCFESWLASLKDRHANTRRKWYQIVRHFCMYRQRSEPGCFVPSVEGAAKRQPYVTPIILEPRQIGRMLGLASKLPKTSASPLRAPALRLALVLLYTCGLRSGELRRLTMGDIEEQGTVLHIRESKFHKSRLVPLSSSTTHELQAYLRKRRPFCATARTAIFMLTVPSDFGMRCGGFLMPPVSGMDKGDGLACMISGTALPCRRLSVGTGTGPTFRAAYRNWPSIWGTFPSNLRPTICIGSPHYNA
jgi:integrase/recombinase XerD